MSHNFIDYNWDNILTYSNLSKLKVHNQKHMSSIFHLSNNLSSTLIYIMSWRVHNKAHILKRKFMIR